jgi:competence protein ComEC
MQWAIGGFCLGGVMLALPWPLGPRLPELALLGSVLGVLLCVTAAAAATRAAAERWQRAASLCCLGFCLGLGWSAWSHHQALSQRVGDMPAGEAVRLQVRVVGDPVSLSGAPQQIPASRFRARVVEAPPALRGQLEGRDLRLSWYGAPSLVRGELWDLSAVVRRPWGYANPAGFDYERWLLGSRVQGTGFVRAGTRFEAARPGYVQRVRDDLSDRLVRLNLPRSGVLEALLVGRSERIPAAQWEVFRATGTVHLMVISGLHVSLAALLGYVAGAWSARAIPLLPLYLNARLAGSVAGLVAATAYVALAGAGLPALRALIMAAAGLLLGVWARPGRFAGGLVLALALVLLIQPLAVHLQGFWLSFGAVGILLLSMGRSLKRPGRWRTMAAARRLLEAQLALSVGMLPLVALHTGELPWTGVAANLVAVPAVSLGVVPAVLMGGVLSTLWPAAADLLFVAADRLLGWVLAWLDWLAQQPPRPAAATRGALLAAQLGVLCWLCGAPRRYLAVSGSCALLVLAHQAPALPHGVFRLTVLDVGQGDAVLVDTRHHRLLFDSGPGFPSGFETGSAVVVPNVAATGAPRLDRLIISHDHLDHSGGMAAVLARVPVGEVFTSDGVSPGRDCHGEAWESDGVRFAVLTLRRPSGASENDRSCVLLIDDGRRRALLPGDIGAGVEAALVRALEGPVDVLMAPHHGSTTSSSRLLIRVARPAVVLISAGRGNRYGHPHPRVVDRYEATGATVHQTGREGALQWRSDQPERVVAWRVARAPYWRSRDGPGPPSRR